MPPKTLLWYRPELGLNRTLMVRLRQSGVAPADMERRMRSCFCVTVLPRVAPGSWFYPSRSSSSVLHLARKPLKIRVDFFKIKCSWGFEKIESLKRKRKSVFISTKKIMLLSFNLTENAINEEA